MNKPVTKFLLLFISLFCGKTVFAQDYLIESTFLGSRSKFELLVLFGQAVDYDVDLYRIRYKTPGSDLLPDTASGLLVIPQVPAGTQLPIVLYEHGTTAGPTDVPSQLRGGFEVAMAYAAFGFILLPRIISDWVIQGDFIPMCMLPQRLTHPWICSMHPSNIWISMNRNGILISFL